MPPEPTPGLSLADVAGWWTKPDDFSGVTGLLTFRVDMESDSLTAYDAYGYPEETWECWCDSAGFHVDGSSLG